MSAMPPRFPGDPRSRRAAGPDRRHHLLRQVHPAGPAGPVGDVLGGLHRQGPHPGPDPRRAPGFLEPSAKTGWTARLGRERARAGAAASTDLPLCNLILETDDLTEAPAVRRATERIAYLEIENLERYLILLSTAVTISPFLGLLGTVWGIMTSFWDMSSMQSANLTVVAPGHRRGPDHHHRRSGHGHPRGDLLQHAGAQDRPGGQRDGPAAHHPRGGGRRRPRRRGPAGRDLARRPDAA